MIYSLLEAEARGDNLDDFMKPYEEKAQAASENSKSKSDGGEPAGQDVCTRMEGKELDPHAV